MWVCLKMLCTPKPNCFADHYPYEKWLFHWDSLFSDKPRCDMEVTPTLQTSNKKLEHHYNRYSFILTTIYVYI